jgi:hypothetical protein
MTCAERSAADGVAPVTATGDRRLRWREQAVRAPAGSGVQADDGVEVDRAASLELGHLRERHWPPHQRVRTSPLTPFLIVVFLAQAVAFWLLATKA